ncbi:hypothetical protein BDD12DRAFT_809393 [Trichophaea hybrida]|nr:hypothetical protein BDD12DRAFT_809393 [Trichophaea hybrida]
MVYVATSVDVLIGYLKHGKNSYKYQTSRRRPKHRNPINTKRGFNIYLQPKNYISINISIKGFLHPSWSEKTCSRLSKTAPRPLFKISDPDAQARETITIVVKPTNQIRNTVQHLLAEFLRWASMIAHWQNMMYPPNLAQLPPWGSLSSVQPDYVDKFLGSPRVSLGVTVGVAAVTLYMGIIYGKQSVKESQVANNYALAGLCAAYPVYFMYF